MNALFASGHALDIVIVVIIAEFIWLVAKGRNATAVALLLLPAVFILLALRAALTLHIADLRHRELI